MSGHWPASNSRPPNGGAGGAPFSNWGRPQSGGGSSAQHNRQGQSQELAKQEAARRRKEQAAIAAQAQKRKEGSDLAKDLFAAPTRASSLESSGSVEKVLGTFSEAHKGGLIHNTYKDNYFGVDYLPPTPAPAKEHVIGEEDDEPVSSSGGQGPYSNSSGGGRNNPAPYSRPTHAAPRPPAAPKPTSQRAPLKPPPVPMASWSAPPTSMAPPGALSRGGPNSKGLLPRPPQQVRPNKPAPLVIDKKTANNTSFEDDDVETMLEDMKYPFRNIPDLGGLPTPLTALAPTPRVEFEEMGTQRHKPVYQVDSGLGFNFNPLELSSKAHQPPTPSVKAPVSSPPKAAKAAMATTAAPVITKDSSSSDSSSDSESGETDNDKSGKGSESESEKDEDKDKDDFSLATMVMATKNSPRLGSLSDRSNPKPSPSPQYPTPSPRAYITPSPGGALPLPSPSSLSKPEGNVLPPPLPPMPSSPPYPLSPIASPTKQRTPDLKLKKSNAHPPASSEDEDGRAPRSRPKQPVKKPRKSNKTSNNSKIKSASHVNDSDSDSPSPAPSSKQPRSYSASPQKRPKPSPSAPTSRPTSTHSTPARTSARAQANLAPPEPSDRSSSPTSPTLSRSANVMQGRAPPVLSASDSEMEDIDNGVGAKHEPAQDNTKKSAIKNTIFGRMLVGGKGKGKGGKNKGGILVVSKEDDSSAARGETTPSPKTSPVQVVVEKPPPSPKMIGEPDKTPKSASQRSNRENSQNWGNLPDDLQISEDDEGEITSPPPPQPPQPQPQPLVSRSSSTSSSSSSSKRRPSIIVTIPLSRLGKTLISLQTRFRSQTSKLAKKPMVKQECWITNEEEPGGGGRKRKISEKVDMMVTKLIPSEGRHDSVTDPRVTNGSDSSSSSRSQPQHRKVNNRTQSDSVNDNNSDTKYTTGASALASSVQVPSGYTAGLNGGMVPPGGVATGGVGGGEEEESRDRKRRDRDCLDEEVVSAVSKRLKSDAEEEMGGGGAVPNVYYPVSDILPPVGEAGLPPAHPTWPGCLMPPPTHPPTQRVYYSYFERRHQDEAFEDEDNVVEEAKRLKHEADGETIMETKCRKYLQAIMLFSVHGSRTENMGDKANAYNMYNQTLHLIKYVMKLTASKNAKKDIDIRFVVMSLRAQSLLNLRLYKMKRHELKDYQRTIQDALAKSVEEEGEQQPGGQISPTPSPAGSEGSNCSKSSGYTSSGENRLPGVLTPPTAPPICLSIPKNVMQNQFNFCSYLSQCHELWEQADLYVSKGQCEDFFIQLDQECGPLTLHSSLKDLVNYTRKGLSTLSEDSRGTRALGGFYQGGLYSSSDESKALK